jgi:hypothetical protein
MKTIDICFLVFNSKSERCFGIIENLNYPKNLIRVSVFSDRQIDHRFVHHLTTEEEAYSYIRINSSADYIWIIQADHIINHPETLNHLLAEDKDIASALLKEKDSNFSNFWGDISELGWYKRSDDYFDILERKKTGAFKVPYINGNILFRREVYQRNPFLTTEHTDWDLDMNICFNLRISGEELFIVNKEVYGNIEKSDVFLERNILDGWTEETLLHPDFLNFLKNFRLNRSNVETSVFKELGTDIWQIPFFTPGFCDYLIQVAEERNQWSAGAYARPDEFDKRLGAIENHPTQDVHLTQLNLHHWWLDTVVKKYFAAIVSYLYRYNTKGYNISFIVRYSEQGQKKLDGHHDASTYTTNIALNNFGTDYTGGGCRFVHKNVTVIGNPKGYMTLHPGRLTHFHEALPIDSGKRYILVSFND